MLNFDATNLPQSSFVSLYPKYFRPTPKVDLMPTVWRLPPSKARKPQKLSVNLGIWKIPGKTADFRPKHIICTFSESYAYKGSFEFFFYTFLLHPVMREFCWNTQAETLTSFLHYVVYEIEMALVLVFDFWFAQFVLGNLSSGRYSKCIWPFHFL